MRKSLITASALLGVTLGGGVVAQTIGSVSNGYVEEGNLYRPGNVINTITMSNHGQDATTCRKACDAESNCNAYSYVQQAANRKPVCYLRMLALPRNATRNHGFTRVVSGTKLSLLPDIHKITPYPSRAIQGGVELRSFKVDYQDPVACSDACYRDGNCRGFTYTPRTVLPKRAPAMCTLLSKNGTLTAQTRAGYLSGSKSPLSVPSKSRLPSRSYNPEIINRDIRPQRPVIERQGGATISDPKTDQNPALSDDNETQFPGEMLQPDER